MTPKQFKALRGSQSQRAFAAELGISQPLVALIETGKREVPEPVLKYLELTKAIRIMEKVRK